jgi:signal transduction histidine kinase
VALAQTVAQLAGSAPTNDILAGIARHAVEGTRALSAGISVLGGENGPGVGGNYGPRGPCYGRTGPSGSASDDARGVDVIAAMTAGGITAGGVPGKVVVLSDARTVWEASPVMAGFARSMSGQAWDGAICVPLAWENRVIGVLGVYLPAGLAGPSEGELAFCTTLGDQAAVAVSHARLSERAGEAAALEERGRLARELHDSVSQALFSMTMHARAAQLSLTRAGIDPGAPMSRSVEQLAELARGILAEMRALIFELRPEALAEEGLLGALTKQAAALTAREDVSVTLTSSGDEVQLAGDVEEHVYRIVSEALHNVVKHARADTATVVVTVTPRTTRVVVSDDGIGFDHDARDASHLGMRTMTDRAEAIGATVTVGDRDDAQARPAGRPGTIVTLTVPTDPSAHRAG